MPRDGFFKQGLLIPELSILKRPPKAAFFLNYFLFLSIAFSLKLYNLNNISYYLNINSHEEGQLFKKLKLWGLFSLFFVLTACASAHVQPVTPYSEAKLPKPQVILVYDFSLPKANIELNQSVGAKLVRYAKNQSQEDQKKQLGLAVANNLSNQLVAELRRLGLPAVHATGKQSVPADALLIVGQFENINEGNRLRRVVLGFGAGRSEVKSHVQLYYLPNRLVVALDTSAKSATRPGIIPMTGAGAALGHLEQSLIISTSVNGIGEIFHTSAEQDANRTAKEIVKQLKPFFIKEGWVVVIH